MEKAERLEAEKKNQERLKLALRVKVMKGETHGNH